MYNPRVFNIMWYDIDTGHVVTHKNSNEILNIDTPVKNAGVQAAWSVCS